MRVFSCINIGYRLVSRKAWNKWDNLFVWETLKYESPHGENSTEKSLGNFSLLNVYANTTLN